MNQYRCETCKFKDATNEELRVFHLRLCTKCNFIIEPISHDQMEIHGCASHSDFDPDKQKIDNAITFACEKHDAEVREKVLGELERKMDARSNEHHSFINLLEERGETNTELWRIQHQRLYALDEVYEWIAELQQEGNGER